MRHLSWRVHNHPKKTSFTTRCGATVSAPLRQITYICLDGFSRRSRNSASYKTYFTWAIRLASFPCLLVSLVGVVFDGVGEVGSATAPFSEGFAFGEVLRLSGRTVFISLSYAMRAVTGYSAPQTQGKEHETKNHQRKMFCFHLKPDNAYYVNALGAGLFFKSL